ncbi:MAG: glutamate--tRNA ligase [Acidimicrobiia bacterium]
MPPRVRFAPAPTGYLHVGGAWLALYNWMFARRHGGTLVLRIEDTDAARSTDESVEAMGRGLHWLGIDWDEGPFRQSERFDRYREGVETLLGAGLAYYCECTSEDLKARGAPAYDGYCRQRGLGPGPGRAVRSRTPDEGTTVVHDVIRGDIPFEHALLEDFVIVRSDGSPGFYLPNAMDDLDMGITHVIRGEDLLSSTPRVLLLRRALTSEPDPVYAHLPLLVDERRRKLSKRYHSVAVEEYRSKGYLSQALRNYLALLGWSPRDGREILPIDEMVAQFALEDVNPSPAFFDHQKLDHVNAEYIRALPVGMFVRESLPWLESESPWPPERFDLGRFKTVAPHVQERVRTLSEVPALVDFLFLEEPEVDQASWDKVMADPVAAGVLDDAIEGYSSAEWTAPTLHELTRAVADRHGLKLGKAQAPIRVAVTGRSVGPPLFESLEALGRDQTLARLRRARSRLGVE